MTIRVEERRRKAAPRAHDELEGAPEAATESTVGPAAGENG
jgi:hypothetical protein